MGLAASQARFLAITARKADCEFRSMQIAQNKLSVTREMEQVTQDYQNAINATKMVWDYDGTQSFLTDVSYGLLTTPSYLNNFNPYLVTNRAGQVIVDRKIAAAALAAGIGTNGGSRNEANFRTFINMLQANNVISSSTKEDVVGILNTAATPTLAEAMRNKSRWLENAINYQHAADSNFSGGINEITNAVQMAGSGNILSGGSSGNQSGNNGNTSGTNNDNTTSTATNVNKPSQGYTYKEMKITSGGSPVLVYADKYDDKEYFIYSHIGKVPTYKNITSKVNELGEENYLEDAPSAYDKNNGYGSEPMSKNEYVDTGILGLTKRLQNGYNESENIQIEVNDTDKSFTSGYASGTAIKVNHNVQNTITLSDILTKDVCLIGTLADEYFDYNDSNYPELDTSIHEDILDIFEKGINAIAKALDYDISTSSSFASAKAYTLKKYGLIDGSFDNPITVKELSSAGIGKVHEEVEKAASENNGIVFIKNSGRKANSAAAINLSNLFAYFLTVLDGFETGWNSNYVAGDTKENSFFITQDPDFRFAVLKEQTETNQNVMKTDFYMQLFNNLCVNGYVVEDQVTDNKYLEQMLKNGAYFLCGLNSDGYFYQSRYNDDVRTLIKVVNDEDAKAQAESEYSYQKARLTSKEDKLDLEMKNIDMEIASLTSEYDSVKNLISKSVEKTFKQFES